MEVSTKTVFLVSSLMKRRMVWLLLPLAGRGRMVRSIKLVGLRSIYVCAGENVLKSDVYA